MMRKGLGAFIVAGLGGVMLLGRAELPGQPTAGGEEALQPLIRRAQQEFFCTRQLFPVSSYEPNDAFLRYPLSPSQRARYQEAIMPLQELLQRFPQRAKDWLRLGILHLGLCQTEPARQAFQRALEVDPALWEVYPQISEVYRQEGRLEEALQAAEEAIQRAPLEAYPYCQRAAVRVEQHDYEGALEDLEQAEAQDPSVPEIYLGRGLIYLQTGRTAAAGEAFQKACQNNPSYHRAQVMVGIVHFLEGQSEQALAQVEQVLRTEPDYPLALFLWGAVHEDRSDHEIAITAYRRVLEADPEQEYAAYRLGRQYAILDQPQRAREAFEALLQKAPQAALLHLQLGLAYQQLGHFPEAIREFQRVWQQQPQMVYAALSLALAWYSAGQPEQAFATLAEAGRRFPEELQVWGILYRLLEEASAATGPSYREALTALCQQRGPRTQRFLDAVEKWLRAQGALELGQSDLAQSRRFLEEGEVIRAEEQGVKLCEQYDLGVSVRLGPQDEERGLKHLELDQRDGGTQAVPDLAGRSARWTQVDEGHHYIYLDVVEERPPSQEAWVVVEYWDDADNRFLIQYDSTDTDSWLRGAYKETENVWKGNTNTWRHYVFELPDAAFQGRQHEGADFRLFSRGWRDTAVHSVRVLIP